MASLISSPPLTAVILPAAKIGQHNRFLTMRIQLASGLRLSHRIQLQSVAKRYPASPSLFKRTVSCSAAAPETLQIVQNTIAKQLSIDENTVVPHTKFSDLGADSLDTVEIMMALEEKFGVSISEGGAENISTVQEAADLIEKVKGDGA